MAITKIEEVYFYACDDGGAPAETIEATAFMDRCGVPFTKMHYHTASDGQTVLDALNTWWTTRGDEHQLPPLARFPFVIYTEVRDDIPVRNSPVKYLEGLEDIKKIVDIYNTYNKPVV